MRFQLAAALPFTALASIALGQVTHAPTFPFIGDAAGDSFGSSVSGAGDVNNDGFDDIIIGAYQDDDNGVSSGSARVISGATGVTLYSYAGEDIGYRLGESVSGAGDVNNDGFDDFVIGAGDVNNDGFADILVGVPSFFDSTVGSVGRVYVYSGFDGSVLYAINGATTGSNFGSSVSDAGDANGDGFADFLVGATLDDQGTPNGGSATLFSGADGSVLYTFGGDSELDAFGRSVSGAGDVNNDGYADFIVGAPSDDNNGNASGSARVYLSVILPAGPAPCPGDLTGDGVVNFTDLNGVLSNFGNACPE